MPPPYETQFFSINAPVGEDSILPRGAILNYRTFVGRIRVNVQRCAIQPNTQLTNLAGGYYPPLQWRSRCRYPIRFLTAFAQFWL